MAIELNQFKPNVPVPGLYAYMANLPQLHNIIVSPNQEGALMAGAFVTLDGEVTNANAPVVKQAASTDSVFGVVTHNPITNQFVSGERVAIARANDIVWLPVSAAVAQGDLVAFNASNQVATATDNVIGKAITSAAEAGDLVQVELTF